MSKSTVPDLFVDSCFECNSVIKFVFLCANERALKHLCSRAA